MKKSVLIAGLGGASLGTEIFKSLKKSGKYNIYGSDISKFAYGLYEKDLKKTFLVDVKNYIKQTIEICKKEGIDVIIPGGEEPLQLLYKNKSLFDKIGIKLAINSWEIIRMCTDKIKTFNYLKKEKIPVPQTIDIEEIKDLDSLKYPCIIKPSIGTGGSVFTYLAENKEEANLSILYLKKRGMKAIIQEYMPEKEGEYTVGVLSLPTGELVGSIALKRFFNTKLSTLLKYGNRIISSGYSQGLIDEFKDVRKQCEKIAKKLKNKGPLNIQGRYKDGVFYPFEINPRFSASNYLRTLAGFNEVDIFLQYLLEKKCTKPEKIKYGYYFRSLKEKYIDKTEIKNA